MSSFREFLTENSNLNSKNNNYSSDDSYLNEEFRTDEQGIKQLQAREAELLTKTSSIREKIRKLESKNSLLLYKLAGITNNLMNSLETGEKNTQMEKGFEEVAKESEKVDKELASLYKMKAPFDAELAKIRSTVQKMVKRNAKKAGLHPYDYVTKYDLHSR